jgi:hypothetical protein
MVIRKFIEYTFLIPHRNRPLHVKFYSLLGINIQNNNIPATSWYLCTPSCGDVVTRDPREMELCRSTLNNNIIMYKFQKSILISQMCDI